METALRAKDAADGHLPRKRYQAVRNQRSVESEVRWSMIEIRTVVEFPSLWHRVAIARNEGAIQIVLPGHGIRHQRWDTDKIICGSVCRKQTGAATGLYLADEA